MYPTAPSQIIYLHCRLGKQGMRCILTSTELAVVVEKYIEAKVN
jgi:hypothetical protein